MTLVSGARLGSYEIVAALGAGGMGEVYKATDIRLNRVVAVKVLPAPFASDPDRRERFERESRAVAALNHPHICQLHDVGEAAVAGADAPIRFLVMEYLEGQTLEERLLRGPLPMADVLRVAIELADALDHAHRRGLVHRDLKPGNVMLTRTGTKLLDFGLSRLQPPTDLTALTTVIEGRAPLTAEGAVLGTYPYMSPEQLTGREADARSDIFAFGAVLHEMVTGERAFAGTTAATVIGAILHTEPPPVSARQSLAPALLDRVVSRCLAKDPDNRWQTARDVVLELKWISDQSAVGVAATTTATTKSTVRTWSVLGVLALVGAASVAAYSWRSDSPSTPVVHLPLAPPNGLASDAMSNWPVVISPDGTRLVFSALGPNGRPVLWVRALDALDAKPIADTDGGAFPFFSPDGRSIGFFAQRMLKKVRLDGGPVQILCEARVPRGGTWSVNDVILFSAGAGNELYWVSAGGGVATPLPSDGVNQERVQPSFLPDGRHFVYAARPQRFGVFIGSLDDPTPTPLLDGYSGVAYVRGYLLLLRGATPVSTAMTLLAQPFDATTRQLAGAPGPLADQIVFDTLQGLGYFSASHTGTLIYGNVHWRTTRLTWFDRTGATLGYSGVAGLFSQPSLSRDGTRIAVQRIDPVTHDADLWAVNAASGLATRLTEGQFGFGPSWSPDGTRVVYSSARKSTPNLYVRDVATSGAEHRLFESPLVNHATDWSRDGRVIVYATLNKSSGFDLMKLPMDGPEGDRLPTPYLATPFDEHHGRVSPDGRWLAYRSDESGIEEVYLQSFPTPGAKQLISVNGGTEPVWRADGTELYYVAPAGMLMVVPITLGATVKVGTPAPAFTSRPSGRIARPVPNAWTFAVSNDGKRFLINVTDDSGPAPSPTNILFNWPSLLQTAR